MPLVSKSFSDIITFTRASSGTYFDATGTLQTATTNNARFDYDPSTLAARGMLVEEQRTNSIRNNTMVGAVAGTPGTAPTNWDIVSSGTGITQQIVGTGTEDGITYIDVRFSGTGSGSASPQIRPETTTGIVAASGQTWTSSYYLRIVGGSTTGCAGTFQQIWQERNASGVTLNTATVAIADPTTSALKTQRSILTRTLTDVGTARLTNRFQWTFTDGVAVDITLRIGLPQLEQGAFATSVISTSTAAATRAADVASVNTLSPWYNASAGTIFCDWSIPVALDSTRFSSPSAFSDGTTNNRIISVFNSDITNNYVGMYVANAGSEQANSVSTISDATLQFKNAFAYQQNNFAFSVNGASAVTDSAGTVPTVTQLQIGLAPSVNVISGHIRRITYYPRRLSNAELQGITT